MSGIMITDQEMGLLRLLPQSFLDEQSGAARKIIANDAAFLIIETIVFGLYLWSRHLHDRARGVETRVLLPIAYLANVGLLIAGFVEVNYGGAGYHILAVFLRNKSQAILYLKVQAAIEIIYLIAITSAKFAVIVLYLRVFTDRWVRHSTLITGVLIVGNLVAGVLMSFLICRPYSAKWNIETGGVCGDIMATFRWVSLPNIITDVAILLLPAWSLYHLQMGRTQKLTLTFTFLVGSLGIVAAIIRFITFFEVRMVDDPTFFCTKTAIATSAEAGAYLVCACLPGLRPLLHHAQKWLQSFKRNNDRPSVSKEQILPLSRAKHQRFVPLDISSESI